jgi:malate synthase
MVSMAAGHIDFWFTMGSTYSYLSVMRLVQLERLTGIRFRWRPFHLLVILQEIALAYSVEGGALVVRLRDDVSTGLARRAQFVGYRGEPAAPSALLLRNHNLHVEIKIDRASLVGREDPAGITDIVLEAAVTTIMDLEDSVAVVDGVS